MSITNFIDNHLKSVFRRFGEFVACYKFCFLIIPILVCGVLSVGLLRIQYSSDPDHLLTPDNGEGRREKAIAEKYFPTNFSRFDATRSIKFGLYGYVMVTGLDGKDTVLNPEEWAEVRAIQDQILNIEVEDSNGVVYKYEDICARWQGKCYTNSLLSVADTFAVINQGIFREPVESYYSSLYNMTQQFSYHFGSNFTVQDLVESKKDLLNKLDTIEQLTNSSYEDINITLKLFKQGLEDLESLTMGLYEQFETHLKPALEAMNLPAYFGGLTWMNKGLEEADLCGLLSMPIFNNESSLCNSNTPVEFVETVMEVTGQISEQHANVMEILLKKLRSRLMGALKTLNVKESTQKILEVLRELKVQTSEVVKRLESLEHSGSGSPINQLVKAEAVLIGVLLDSDLYPEIGEAWEVEFLKTITNMKLQHTYANPLVSNSLKYEMIKSVAQIPPILTVNIICMIAFSMAVLIRRNSVESKPWLGLAGVVSTVMATFSAFGLLILCGAEFTNFNFGAIFIMIGIGLDDTFVVLNSWQHTDRKASVSERMGVCLAESGVSILITSLTDALSFFTAIMAPYPYVQIFCLYSGTCIVFLFMFQITFFNACLAWSGEHEKDGRSGLTLTKVTGNGDVYKGCLCFKFGEYQVDVPNSEERKMKIDLAEQASRVLRYILRSRSTRVIVCFCFIGYMIVSIYGIMNIQVYFDKTKLINYDSTMTDFVRLEDRLFRDKAFTISVIVEGEMNYTDPNTRRRLQNLLHDLEALPKISDHLTKSWLQHFETVASAKEIFLNESHSYASETEFVRDVYEYYKDRDTSFSLDVAFNENNTRIVASRFLVQGEKIRSTSDEEKLVLDIRRVCKQHTDGSFGVTAFNSYFIYTDQYLTVFSQTLQCVASTGIIVVAISLLLLPDLLAAVATVISIISTLIGTIGIMSVWGIALDGITLINLVMCIGFSVDFSAHFAYHYIDIKKSSKDSDVVDRSLVSVFKPISQAAASTILGLLGLVLAPSPGFIIFFKIIFIVIVLGVIHALILLPFLLQFLVDSRSRLKRSDSPDPAVLLSVKKISEEVVLKAKIDEKGAFDNHAFDHSKL